MNGMAKIIGITLETVGAITLGRMAIKSAREKHKIEQELFMSKLTLNLKEIESVLKDAKIRRLEKERKTRCVYYP